MSSAKYDGPDYWLWQAPAEQSLGSGSQAEYSVGDGGTVDKSNSGLGETK